MQGEKLWTNKVVACDQILRDSSSQMPVVRDEFFGAMIILGVNTRYLGKSKDDGHVCAMESS